MPFEQSVLTSMSSSYSTIIKSFTSRKILHNRWHTLSSNWRLVVSFLTSSLKRVGLKKTSADTTSSRSSMQSSSATATASRTETWSRRTSCSIKTGASRLLILGLLLLQKAEMAQASSRQLWEPTGTWLQNSIWDVSTRVKRSTFLPSVSFCLWCTACIHHLTQQLQRINTMLLWPVKTLILFGRNTRRISLTRKNFILRSSRICSKRSPGWTQTKESHSRRSSNTHGSPRTANWPLLTSRKSSKNDSRSSRSKLTTWASPISTVPSPRRFKAQSTTPATETATKRRTTCTALRSSRASSSHTPRPSKLRPRCSPSTTQLWSSPSWWIPYSKSFRIWSREEPSTAATQSRSTPPLSRWWWAWRDRPTQAPLGASDSSSSSWSTPTPCSALGLPKWRGVSSRWIFSWESSNKKWKRSWLINTPIDIIC